MSEHPKYSKECNSSLLTVSNYNNQLRIFLEDIFDESSLKIIPVQDSQLQLDSMKSIHFSSHYTNLVHSKRFPLLVAQGKQAIELFDTSKDEKSMETTELLKIDSIIESLTLSNYSTEYIFVTNKDTVHLWNIQNKEMGHIQIPNEQIKSSKNQKQISSSSYSSCSTSHPLIYTISKEDQLYNVDFRQPTIYPFYHSPFPIYSISSIPHDFKHLLISSNSKLFLYDIRNPQIPQFSVYLPSYYTGNIHVTPFNNNNEYLISTYSSYPDSSVLSTAYLSSSLCLPFLDLKNAPQVQRKHFASPILPFPQEMINPLFISNSIFGFDSISTHPDTVQTFIYSQNESHRDADITIYEQTLNPDSRLLIHSQSKHYSISDERKTTTQDLRNQKMNIQPFFDMMKTYDSLLLNSNINENQVDQEQENILQSLLFLPDTDPNWKFIDEFIESQSNYFNTLHTLYEFMLAFFISTKIRIPYDSLKKYTETKKSLYIFNHPSLTSLYQSNLYCSCSLDHKDSPCSNHCIFYYTHCITLTQLKENPYFPKTNEDYDDNEEVNSILKEWNKEIKI